MERSEYAGVLQKVEAELAEIQGSGAEDTRHLAEAREGIRRLIADEDGGTRESLLGRMRDLVHHLEEDHPRAAYAIGRAADVLANMGI